MVFGNAPASRAVLLALCASAALSACGQPDPQEAAIDLAMADPQEIAAASVPPPPSDPLMIGSPEARRDMYCSALITASNPMPSSAMSPTDEARLVKAQNLAMIIGDAGVNRLIAEGAAHATHAAVISEAYIAEAEKDMAAGSLRHSLEECILRAEQAPLPE
jgi:hypothetical protein